MLSASALSRVVEALTRAVTVRVEGAIGTVSDEDRMSLANEIDGIRDQVLSQANTAFHRIYLFTATKVYEAAICAGYEPSVRCYRLR